MARLTHLIKRQETTVNRSKGGRKAFRGLVLHIAAGYYEGTISWQKNPTSKVSSEFVIGREPGEWAQMMDLDDAGWTQKSGNGYWVATENAGFILGHKLHKPGWEKLSDWQVEANAQILAWLHTNKGVPLQVTTTPTKHGLGHHSMGAENGVDWGHPACPGKPIIAQKAAILARAKQIVNGKDDDMAALTDAQAKQLANVERMLGKLLKGGLGPDPNGRPDNAATFHLRSILDAEDPLLGENFPGWQPLSPAGLKQLAARLDALHAELDALKGQAPELDYDRLAAAVVGALLRGIAGQA